MLRRLARPRVSFCVGKTAATRPRPAMILARSIFDIQVIRRTTITRRSGSGLPRLHGTKRLCRGSVVCRSRQVGRNRSRAHRFPAHACRREESPISGRVRRNDRPLWPRRRGPRRHAAELSDDAAALAFACEIVRELMPRGIASTHPSSLVKVRDETRPTVFSIPFLPACA